MGIGKKSASDIDHSKKRTIGIDTGESLDAPVFTTTEGASLIGTDPSQPNNKPVPPDEDMTKWLKEDAWKKPQWLKRNQKSKAEAGYKNYYLNFLRARYLRLEDDFRTAYNNFYNTQYMDLVTARRIISHLTSAKDILDDDDCDINDAITLLDLADQYMVWLYPPHVAKARAYGLAAELRVKKSVWADYLVTEASRTGQTLGGLRAALDKAIESINKANQATMISDGLQIQRLNTARQWSAIVLSLSILIVPILINFDIEFWSKTFLNRFAPDFRPWVVTICMAIFGAGGAFFSSLMSVRTTRTVLTDFQENMKNNQLKLFIGALAAVILFTFLSWQIVPGLELKNAGSFIFLAFISGFSERFFLDLLNIDEKNGSAPRPAAPPLAPPPANANSGDDLIGKQAAILETDAPNAEVAADTEGVAQADEAATADVNTRRIN